MKYRTIFCLLLSVFMIVLCLTGCRDDEQKISTDESSPAETAAATDSVETFGTDELTETVEDESVQPAQEQGESSDANISDEPMVIEVPGDVEFGGD